MHQHLKKASGSREHAFAIRRKGMRVKNYLDPRCKIIIEKDLVLLKLALHLYSKICSQRQKDREKRIFERRVCNHYHSLHERRLTKYRERQQLES